MYGNFSALGLLHVGDEILNVGGHAVRDKTPDEVVNLLVSYFTYLFSK